MTTMPGLLRGIARTAVIAGTATAVSNRVSRRQEGRWAEQDAAALPAGPDPTGSNGSARLAQLRELDDLRRRGVLTEAEFEEQKAFILRY
jgi:hypothetical protein